MQQMRMCLINVKTDLNECKQHKMETGAELIKIWLQKYIYLISRNHWVGSLLYSGVEGKQFKQQ